MKRVTPVLFFFTGVLLLGGFALAADGRGGYTGGQPAQAGAASRGTVAIEQADTRDTLRLQGREAPKLPRTATDREKHLTPRALAIRYPKQVYRMQHALLTFGNKRRGADKAIRNLIRRLDVEPL